MMYLGVTILEDLHEFLTGVRAIRGNIIRKHSKKLDQLGDISFPLDIKKWSLIKSKINSKTIFDYLHNDKNLEQQIHNLLESSKTWVLHFDNYKLINNDIHLYLSRTNTIQFCIKQITEEGSSYGLKSKIFKNKINVVSDQSPNDDAKQINLTDLRMGILQEIITNFLDNLTENHEIHDCDITITTNSKKKESVIVCGSILNENGVKDLKTTADELYQKRAIDMQLMAQHKYGVQVKPSWRDYFEKLGKASVILEMLQNKPHKTLKVTLSNLQTANKCPSFIFYNCARIYSLLKQFNENVANNLYPELPSVDVIDFSLLKQSEEWELVFVFLLQFPSVIVNCVSDIKSGIINPHSLISFLSNLSSVFSIYYKRIKILTSSKEHLLPVLYARIYLVRSIQQIFYISFSLLNIEPVKEM